MPEKQLKAEPREAPKKETSTQPAASTVTRYVTLAMFQQSLNIDEIARNRNLSRFTIMKHLTELLEGGEQIDIDRLIERERYEVIADAIRQVDSYLLRPVKDFLGEDYSYEEIRLVSAAMRRVEL